MEGVRPITVIWWSWLPAIVVQAENESMSFQRWSSHADEDTRYARARLQMMLQRWHTSAKAFSMAFGRTAPDKRSIILRRNASRPPRPRLIPEGTAAEIERRNTPAQEK